MRIVIGIPCYQNASSETLEDYMRLAYYCGRRIPQHEFFVAIKSKTEQFRARNSIVEAALQIGGDYLLFLDDDHVIDWEVTPGFSIDGAGGVKIAPNSRYGMVEKFVAHMEADPQLGIVGAVYYHRGAECRPVLMKEGKDGGFYWLRDDEIKGELQEVAVQGGGCMLLRLSIFDKIRAPWFEPEFDLGTDIQICKKAREAGFKVCCDTSIQIGHVLSKREVVTPQNRLQISMENARGGRDEGVDRAWQSSSALNLYRADAEEYLGMTYQEMGAVAIRYDMRDLVKYKDDLHAYYASRGKEQLARQVLFHHTPGMREEMHFIHSLINTSVEGYGAEYGCGSAPVSFDLALRGHKIDFIDIDGSGAYEFTKWRAAKRGIQCGWTLQGPYDYVLMLDSIEHIVEWQEVLGKVVVSLKEGGGLITNYFRNQDYANPEHVSMDKQAVKKFLIEHGVYPINDFIWVRKDLGFMDRKEEAA
jgi:hypothetical protein